MELKNVCAVVTFFPAYACVGYVVCVDLAGGARARGRALCAFATSKIQHGPSVILWSLSIIDRSADQPRRERVRDRARALTT